MDNKKDVPINTEVIRDDKGLFVKGTAPGPGPSKQTQEDKDRKEVRRIAVEKYVHELTESLKDISPVLKVKALSGDMVAIKEINDRAMGKAPQSTTLSGDPENPLVTTGITDEEVKKMIETYGQGKNSESNS